MHNRDHESWSQASLLHYRNYIHNYPLDNAWIISARRSLKYLSHDSWLRYFKLVLSKKFQVDLDVWILTRRAVGAEQLVFHVHNLCRLFLIILRRHNWRTSFNYVFTCLIVNILITPRKIIIFIFWDVFIKPFYWIKD